MLLLGTVVSTKRAKYIKTQICKKITNLNEAHVDKLIELHLNFTMFCKYIANLIRFGERAKLLYLNKLNNTKWLQTVPNSYNIIASLVKEVRSYIDIGPKWLDDHLAGFIVCNLCSYKIVNKICFDIIACNKLISDILSNEQSIFDDEQSIFDDEQSILDDEQSILDDNLKIDYFANSFHLYTLEIKKRLIFRQVIPSINITNNIIQSFAMKFFEVKFMSYIVISFMISKTKYDKLFFVENMSLIPVILYGRIGANDYIDDVVSEVYNSIENDDFAKSLPSDTLYTPYMIKSTLDDAGVEYTYHSILYIVKNILSYYNIFDVVVEIMEEAYLLEST